MQKNIESVLSEGRYVAPSADFKSKARISSEKEFQSLYLKSIQKPEDFWAEQAAQLHWFKKPERVLNWKLPRAKWFEGGQTNISYNCLDRHIEAGRGDKTAIIFESEAGKVQSLSFADLLKRVSKFANLLEKEGIKKGDRVAIYMPLIPDALVAMQACVRIGAVHTVVFGGFSSTALGERIQFSEAKAVITSFGGARRGKNIPLKSAVDEAVADCPSIKKVFVFSWPQAAEAQSDKEILVEERLVDMPDSHQAAALESDHPSFILFTSGSTGKPKGILHGTAGYMLYTYLTSRYVFDLRDEDIFWCTADVGWITGHSYLAYGPLLNGATLFMYEGAPDFPKYDRFWQMIDRHKISILYTAPTAIRAFIKWGDEWLESHSLSSLRLLGSVGEPINPEAWLWYYEKVGKNRCPIVDTWWQTETGGIMISTLPGVHEMKPGSAGVPLFGVEAKIVDQAGVEVPSGQGGYLVLAQAWPGMLQGIYKEEDRYREQYWSKIPNHYFAGDGAKKDKDGRFWVMGRIDDVINVSGHRLGTMEIESALVSHEAVAEAAVVGIPDEIKGEAIVAFVSLESSFSASDELSKSLSAHVQSQIGAIARPSKIKFTQSLPKTRSGKIMRRLLRGVASGNEEGQDTSTLEDSGVLDQLRSED